MAKSKKMNLDKTKKSKTIIKRNLKSGLKEDLGYMKEGAKVAADVIIPRSKEDFAWLFAGGAAVRAIGGIGKKGAKYVNKVYRNMGK
jgi:hypothetical protein